jgi:2-methylcitrate dehydratase
MPDTLADHLAEFALTIRFEDLPRPVIDQARRRLIDSFGCAAGAVFEPAPIIARRAARNVLGEPGGTLFGGGRSSADWAAFANGVHLRYLDCNDTYLSLEPAHPSDNWAAVMAVGEHVGAGGRDWIAAGAVAYEVQCRLCDAASIRARGWDHVTYGHLSSALAAARLLKLDHAQTVNALGIAGTTSAALRLTRAGELSMWKGCAFAHAARNGVFAALLAQFGMTGPAPLFEGDMGFWQQVSGPFTLRQLGGPTVADWMLPRTSIKFVPAEYHSQSAIAAAFELRPAIGDPRRIRSIEIATFRTAVEIIGQDPEKWRPQTRETADHSLPYCTAVALVDGTITADQFSPRRLNDPSLLDLISRTTVVEDPALTAGYPEGIPNRVRVTLDNGTILERTVTYPPGHEKNPLTDDQLRAKFRGLAEPALGAERAEALWVRLSRIEDDPRPHEAISLVAPVD